MKYVFGSPQAFAVHLALAGPLFIVTANWAWGIRTTGPAVALAWLLGGTLQCTVMLSLPTIRPGEESGRQSQGSMWSTAGTAKKLVVYSLLMGYVAATADTDFRLAGYLLPFVGVHHYGSAARVGLAATCLCLQGCLPLTNLKANIRLLALTVAVQLLGIGVVVFGMTFVGLHRGPEALFDARSSVIHEHFPPFLLAMFIPVASLTGFDAYSRLLSGTRDPSYRPLFAIVAAGVLGTLLFTVPLLALAGEESIPSGLLPFVQARMGVHIRTLVEICLLGVVLFRAVVFQLIGTRLLAATVGRDLTSRHLPYRVRSNIPASIALTYAVVGATLCLAWSALSGFGTIWPAFLSVAYAIPIAGALFSDVRKRRTRKAPAELLYWTIGVRIVALVWSLLVFVLLPLLDAARALPIMGIALLIGCLVVLKDPRFTLPRYR